MNTGQNTIVLGGAGAVGQGIVSTLLQCGAHVFVPTRRPAKLHRLSAILGNASYTRLHAMEVDIGDTVDARRYIENLQTIAGRIDGIVVSLGGWRQGGALVDYDPKDWADVLSDNLTSHFDAARLFLPMLQKQSNRPCYLMINGGAALEPAQNAGPISIVAAAQTMMARVLMAEHTASGVRVNQLILNTPIITHERPDGPETWLSAEDVGAKCAWLISLEGKEISGEIKTLDAKKSVNKMGADT
ncbi:SDR family oxidoreductase [Gymnodinialimonas sp. 2305UL16-5]|uniref:SDR family oxidoreductase n=1 Tax=Gymnodinialimonas mytili TaxID=3126503 RepID=UPI00309B3B0F